MKIPPLQYSPTIESVDRRTNDIVVMSSVRVFAVIGGVEPSESDDFAASKLYHSYTESDIKTQRIKWAGYVIRMGEERTPEKVFNAQSIDTGRKSRPYLRWIDDLEKDLPVLRTKNSRTLAGRKLTAQGPLWAVKPLRKEG
ncbi:uncharacterized protein TNCV_946021 [Trichonephila clavipes]|nr:uncharacterized protein TNCV_946021 [Trichonephila clavipes]